MEICDDYRDCSGVYGGAPSGDYVPDYDLCDICHKNQAIHNGLCEECLDEIAEQHRQEQEQKETGQYQ